MTTLPNNEIISTHEIAEADWDGGSEPADVTSDIVATHEAEGKGIEFHVSMRDYTVHDMEQLIIEAGARMLVGRHGDSKMAKLIEERAIDLITQQADKALAKVSAEIIDQPITPKYPFAKPDAQPVTMREFIGLTGREYLTAKVDGQGKPTTDNYYSKLRIQHMVEQLVSKSFETEIAKATNAAIVEINAAVKARHDQILNAEKDRIRAALAKAGAA